MKPLSFVVKSQQFQYFCSTRMISSSSILLVLVRLLIPCIVDGAATFALGAETKSFKETTFDARTKARRTSWSLSSSRGREGGRGRVEGERTPSAPHATEDIRRSFARLRDSREFTQPRLNLSSKEPALVLSSSSLFPLSPLVF